VIALAAAFTRGLAAAGILACGKHFPGHGDTTEDSHLALPRIAHDLARLRAIELAPFAAVQAPFIMTAHVVFDAVDPGVPATLSRRALGEILRGELGYRGMILSDDLDMKAIADNFGVADTVERGLIAGCDGFLLCEREDLQHQAFAALVRAAERNAEVRARVEESAARMLAVKRGHAIARPPMNVLGRAEHQALAAAMVQG
jgi:beta-N-acetylhexosaminidase